MGHEIFFKIFRLTQKIFLCSIFLISFSFKLRWSEHKISKPAIKEILERQDILNKSHPLSKYKAKCDINPKKKSLMDLNPDARSLATDTIYHFVTNFLQ